METILEVVEEGNNDVEEEMVDDELQSRNEMIDEVNGESDLIKPRLHLQMCSTSGVQNVGENIDLNILLINGSSFPC